MFGHSNKIIVPALLGLGIFAQNSEINLANNTTMLLMLFLLLKEEDKCEHHHDGHIERGRVTGPRGRSIEFIGDDGLSVYPPYIPSYPGCNPCAPQRFVAPPPCNPCGPRLAPLYIPCNPCGNIATPYAQPFGGGYNPYCNPCGGVGTLPLLDDICRAHRHKHYHKHHGCDHNHDHDDREDRRRDRRLAKQVAREVEDSLRPFERSTSERLERIDRCTCGCAFV